MEENPRAKTKKKGSGDHLFHDYFLKGKSSHFFYSTIGSEIGKLRQVSEGNFHRNDQKLVKFSF